MNIFCECALKIALTRSIFQPKMNQISFGGRALPGPAGGAYSAPQTPSWIKGPTSKGRGGDGTERGREGQERERREGEGKGRKGRVRGREHGSPHITCLHDASGRMFAVNVQSVSVQHLN